MQCPAVPISGTLLCNSRFLVSSETNMHTYLLLFSIYFSESFLSLPLPLSLNAYFKVKHFQTTTIFLHNLFFFAFEHNVRIVLCENMFVFLLHFFFSFIHISLLGQMLFDRPFYFHFTQHTEYMYNCTFYNPFSVAI